MTSAAEFKEDREIFIAGEGEKIRLGLISDARRIGFLVYASSKNAHGFLSEFVGERRNS